MSLRRTSDLTVRAALAVSLLFAGGCTPDVGPCDPFAARQVVFLNTGAASADDGIPMFAGQGLVQTSCGNSQFCHSEAATSTNNRRGVPIGLDFDLDVPCSPSGCDPGGLARLRASQQRAFDLREHILLEVERGTMPPGREGADVVQDAGKFVQVDTSDPFFAGGVESGVPLPEIGSREGRAILANWLACGLPVVERYEEPNSPQDSGRNCRGSTDCVYRVTPNPSIPVPHWPSLYEEMIEPFCGASCHGEGAPDNREESQLDLGNIELAYAQLVDRIAAGEECIDTGMVLVVPGDPEASLLVDKMAEPNPVCGDPMPSGVGLFPDSYMDVLRQWIREGALEGCFDATFANGRAVTPPSLVVAPTRSFTVEAWIQPTAVASRQVIVTLDGSDPAAFEFTLAIDAMGRVEATLDTRNGPITLVHPAVLGGNDVYHHVALMYDADAMPRPAARLFVDGIPVSEDTEYAADDEIMRSLAIGDLPVSVGSAPFAGVISDVRMSNTARYAVDDPPAADEPWFVAGARLVADDETIVLYPIHESPGATMLRDGGSDALHATISGGVTLATVACR
ncbi:MAG: hypothetical protein KC668_09225 [Myxococcales bacterium]|nr:hypothetical protein [Myxococcales bacterium]